MSLLSLEGHAKFLAFRSTTIVLANSYTRSVKRSNVHVSRNYSSWPVQTCLSCRLVDCIFAQSFGRLFVTIRIRHLVLASPNVSLNLCIALNVFVVLSCGSYLCSIVQASHCNYTHKAPRLGQSKRVARFVHSYCLRYLRLSVTSTCQASVHCQSIKYGSLHQVCQYFH